ncbi:DUF427 domain-containing protein [Agromyces salentinus]|uniref:DUF427 domain-containing protein n=1 Tax=Agromyces salentinus TaxID=269421 RepID=A0ABN2MTZ2_9MICO
MKAIWNGTVIAESDDTVIVEGNHYFPRESIVDSHFAPSDNRSVSLEGHRELLPRRGRRVPQPERGVDLPHPVGCRIRDRRARRVLARRRGRRGLTARAGARRRLNR